jgi:hypothetical protein
MSLRPTIRCKSIGSLICQKRNCEHVISYGYIPNPNVPEDFQKDDKQAGNSETCTTLTNVGIPAVSKNISLKTADTPNAVNGYSCEQRNLTDIVATDNTSNSVNGYSREQRNLTDIAATANTSNGIRMSYMFPNYQLVCRLFENLLGH